MSRNTIYAGVSLRLELADDSLATLCFDARSGAVNKFDAQTRGELRAAIDALAGCAGVRGLVLTSAKKAFVVGADITEFRATFRLPEDAFVADMMRTHRLFADIEDLPFATCAVIDGLALGGGFEVCLACDYRVVTDDCSVGLPEIHLGIFPGWGGTIRLPRLIGIDKAVDWIASGRARGGAEALADGAVDAVAPRESLLDAARELLQGAQTSPQRDARRRAKVEPLPLDDEQLANRFNAIRDARTGRSSPDYPALDIAIDAMEEHSTLPRNEAMGVEIRAFIAVSRTQAAASLVGLFLADQYVKKQAKRWAGNARPPARLGVVGAGLMGQAIALQAASNGLLVSLADRSPAALDEAFEGITAELAGRVQRGRLDGAVGDAILARFDRALGIEALDGCALVVVAIDETDGATSSILSDIETVVDSGAVVACNVSVVPIERFAERLRAPERVVGMNFFDPATASLVEVVRGDYSSDEAISCSVAFVSAVGKHPVVVRDGAGFLVNRARFAYLLAFESLVRDGVDFERIDRVMERRGWPTGPARLIDVSGVDAIVYMAGVMAQAYPDRMAPKGRSVTQAMLKAARLGCRSGCGFYRYESAGEGLAGFASDPVAHRIANACAVSRAEIDDEDIVARLMTPMCIEIVRCLEEGVVGSPEEADVSLVRGLGCPRHIGGALRYIDHVGAAAFCEKASRYDSHGAAYVPCAMLERMAAQGDSFFPVD